MWRFGLQAWSGLWRRNVVCSGLFGRTNDYFHARRRAEVFGRDTADVIDRHRFDLYLAFEIVVKTEAYKLIDCNVCGKSGVALISDGFGTEELLLRAN
jgi:hypothetical protein